MPQRRRFSAALKREAVGRLDAPGVGVTQIATDRVFPGQGWPREKEIGHLNRELTRVTKGRDFLREAATCFASGSR